MQNSQSQSRQRKPQPRIEGRKLTEKKTKDTTHQHKEDIREIRFLFGRYQGMTAVSEPDTVISFSFSQLDSVEPKLHREDSLSNQFGVVILKWASEKPKLKLREILDDRAAKSIIPFCSGKIAFLTEIDSEEESNSEMLYLNFAKPTS